jgi:hypothetical protein
MKTKFFMFIKERRKFVDEHRIHVHGAIKCLDHKTKSCICTGSLPGINACGMSNQTVVDSAMRGAFKQENYRHGHLSTFVYVLVAGEQAESDD